MASTPGSQSRYLSYNLREPPKADVLHRSSVVCIMSNELLDYLKGLDLPEDYAIFGSGPLLIRGIIESSNDLDVLCGPVSWRRALAIGKKVHLTDYGVDIVSVLDNRITFGTSWGIGHFDTMALVSSADVIDSLRFVRLEYVAAYKTIRANEKDRRHLAALQDYEQRRASSQGCMH